MTTFILAVDHRNSLRAWLASLGVTATDTDATARTLKRLCVQALAQARDRLQITETPMLLLDEQYGVDAIPAAKEHGLPVVIPAEKSGQPEFIFEHGDSFAAAIEKADPDAVKALVRYNPAGDAELNARSRGRLVRLQDHLRATGRRFMLELLIPPTAEQARAAEQTQTARDSFDDKLRPALTAEAIRQLAADGLRPDWWKLEGNNDPQAAAIVAAAAAPTAEAGCLVLGRGQDRGSVIRWVQIAAATDGFTGFAVGRTLWTDPFAALVRGATDERETADRIADAYLGIASAYRAAAPATAGSTETDSQQSKQWEAGR